MEKTKARKKSKSPPKTQKAILDRHALYELSVQSPEWHVEWFCQAFQEQRGRVPHSLREDFCGTAHLSATWVQSASGNTALGLDLDADTLEYGRKRHWSKLAPEARHRMQIRRQDVLNPTPEKFDLIAACNFSFNVFKERAQLLRYCRSALKSLTRDGLFVLETAGGPGMIGEMQERKVVRAPDLGIPGGKFIYTWEQREFDPITHDVRYAIHFKMKDGQVLKDAFVYDWRLWSLPELRDLMLEAGFKDVKVYWESEHRGAGTGEYTVQTKGDNAFAWVAYIVGVR